MARTTFRPRRKLNQNKKIARTDSNEDTSAKEIAEKLKKFSSVSKNAPDYRIKSLEIHGWICAKCGREFNESNLHKLTVHHKDNNHKNNPPDGSNWENLCIHCHEDEHSRGILSNQIKI
ncbi:MAG: YajD family HNH nuclease [Nitrospinota bacterium]|nr:YajD family HNH nuclease [Nitrospinota bacterium]